VYDFKTLFYTVPLFSLPGRHGRAAWALRGKNQAPFEYPLFTIAAVFQSLPTFALLNALESNALLITKSNTSSI
jgi:hypothetical protein